MNVVPMIRGESEEVSALLTHVISGLTYYNDRARREEIEKYTPEALSKLVQEDPLSVALIRIHRDLAGIIISVYDDALIWLSWFVVAADYRQRGVGSALLSYLEQSAIQRNCHKVWCDTRVPNSDSERVLRKHGFQQICQVENHWYGQDFILWQKQLATIARDHNEMESA